MNLFEQVSSKSKESISLMFGSSSSGSSSGILSILQSKCSHLGESFSQVSANQWKASPSGRVLFAKLTTPVEQVLGEAESLDAMSQALKKAHEAERASTDASEWSIVPAVHAYGKSEDEKRAYLVTDYKDLGGRLGKEAQRTLGRKLALMHKYGSSKNGKFGFDMPTYCGVTKQDNAWEDKWSTFFIERRIGDMVKRIGDPSLSKLEQQLRSKVWPLLYSPEVDQKINPAILHGDLWSGNAGTDSTMGQPVIFDPSSYYGHNEMELGMMRAFGGFTKDCFDAYHEVIPKLEPYYEQRLVSVSMFTGWRIRRTHQLNFAFQDASHLYHMLNHTLMASLHCGSTERPQLTCLRSFTVWWRLCWQRPELDAIVDFLCREGGPSKDKSVMRRTDFYCTAERSSMQVSYNGKHAQLLTPFACKNHLLATLQ